MTKRGQGGGEVVLLCYSILLFSSMCCCYVFIVCMMSCMVSVSFVSFFLSSWVAFVGF